MRKKTICVCFILLLAGCGIQKQDAQIKTCTIQESGINVNVVYEASQESIRKIDVHYHISKDWIDGDPDDMSVDDLKGMESSVLDRLGIEEGKGITSKFSLTDDGLDLDLSINVKKVDEDTLDQLSLGTNLKHAKLDDVVKESEDNGGSCQ